MKHGPAAIFVLGMHRSGTSATTRVMNLMGARIPGDMIPPASDNPYGFWESRRVIEINEALLAAFKSRWNSPLTLPENWLQVSDVRDLHDIAARFLADELNRCGTVVLKDPRMCRLVPFWIEVAQTAGATPSAVLTLRDPTAVAGSLWSRNKTWSVTAYRLWVEHVRAAETATRHLRRAIVSFDALLTDPVRVAERMAAGVGLPVPDDQAWRTVARNFVNAEKITSVAVPRRLERPSAARREAFNLYDRLLRLAEGRREETCAAPGGKIADAHEVEFDAVNRAGARRAQRSPYLPIRARAGLTN